MVDPANRLWILDTGRPLFQPAEYGGPKLVCVDLVTDSVVKTMVFPKDVALPTRYLKDVRFDLRRGQEGIAYLTDSSDQGPNGMVVADLATGESWRRLHEHPSTKAEDLSDFVSIVEGRPVLKRQPDGSAEPAIAMGSDGIAISSDGGRLYYCRLLGFVGPDPVEAVTPTSGALLSTGPVTTTTKTPSRPPACPQPRQNTPSIPAAASTSPPPPPGPESPTN